MQRPVRITQQFAGEQNQVGLAGAQDVFGLHRLGDHADRAGGDTRLLSHALGELGLVARPDWNIGVGSSAAG